MSTGDPVTVVATRDDPVSGWIDNVYGPTGVFVGAGTGFIKTLHGDADVTANIVPVDMAVNAVIVSAWEVANKPRYRFQQTIIHQTIGASRTQARRVTALGTSK
jgi:fatty acyl-CoA reductase